MTALELQDVEVVYRRRGRPAARAVAGVSLTIEAGRIIGLVGESGCGKSTLGRVAVGLQAPTAGSVRFEGRELRAITRRRRAEEDRRLQLVFQNPNSSLNPRRRIGDQIADGLPRNSRQKRAERRARVEELLQRVSLPGSIARRYPHEFSGGQKQRIALARALAASPSMMILDEPLSSLDASAQAQLALELVALSRELQIGMLLISHDLGIVRRVADTVAVMYAGRIVELAPTQALWLEQQHPYTQALIEAVPHADGAGTMPKALPGEVPDLSDPPAGCAFHPRCPHAFEPCSIEEPPLTRAGGSRSVACWLRIEAPGVPAQPPPETVAS